MMSLCFHVIPCGVDHVKIFILQEMKGMIVSQNVEMF